MCKAGLDSVFATITNTSTVKADRPLSWVKKPATFLLYLISPCWSLAQRLQAGAAICDSLRGSRITVTFQSHDHRTVQHRSSKHRILPWLSDSMLLWKQEQRHVGGGSFINIYWWWGRDGGVCGNSDGGLGSLTREAAWLREMRKSFGVWSPPFESHSASFQPCQLGNVIYLLQSPGSHL